MVDIKSKLERGQMQGPEELDRHHRRSHDGPNYHDSTLVSEHDLEHLSEDSPKQKMEVKLFRNGPKVVYDDADEVEEQDGDHHHHHHLANDLKQRRAKVLLSSFEKNPRSKDKLKHSQEKPKHRCRIGQPQDADLETYSIDMMHKIDRLRPDYNGQHL